MGVKKWFGVGTAPTREAGNPSSAPASSEPTSGNLGSVRKDLLRVVMRETLHRNGIPAHWLAAEILRTHSSRREPGFHLRILVRHWDPRLILNAVAFERDLRQRLLLLDSRCGEWLAGLSWQFLLPEDTPFPPLPHSSTWTQSAPADDTAAQAGSKQDPRAQLERLLSARDDEAGLPADGFDPTQPDRL